MSELSSVWESIPRPASSLTRMMLERVEASLIEKDYVSALEQMFSVASVDTHPEVTTALAATVFEVICALDLGRELING
jgi:hypothetical protein